MSVLDELWHCEPEIVAAGIRQVVVKAENQEWPNCICTTTPNIAARIVADHNAGLAAARALADAERALAGERRERAEAMVTIREALVMADQVLAGATWDLVLPGVRATRDKINHAVALTYHHPKGLESLAAGPRADAARPGEDGG